MKREKKEKKKSLNLVVIVLCVLVACVPVSPTISVRERDACAKMTRRGKSSKQEIGKSLFSECVAFEGILLNASTRLALSHFGFIFSSPIFHFNVKREEVFVS